MLFGQIFLYYYIIKVSPHLMLYLLKDKKGIGRLTALETMHYTLVNLKSKRHLDFLSNRVNTNEVLAHGTLISRISRLKHHW
jgi:hypothetical protein